MFMTLHTRYIPRGFFERHEQQSIRIFPLLYNAYFTFIGL